MERLSSMEAGLHRSNISIFVESLSFAELAAAASVSVLCFFVCLICRHDIDSAGQLRGETHILTAATRSHGEFLFRTATSALLSSSVQNDGLNFSQLQSFQSTCRGRISFQSTISICRWKVRRYRVHAAAGYRRRFRSGQCGVVSSTATLARK